MAEILQRRCLERRKTGTHLVTLENDPQKAGQKEQSFASLLRWNYSTHLFPLGAQMLQIDLVCDGNKQLKPTVKC